MPEFSIHLESDQHPILGALTTSVRAGDRICLLGPSGTGKSTLLNAIAGLDPVSGSSIVFHNSPPRIGYLFQEHRLLPWRTLQANLQLAGASTAEATRLLADVGLAGKAHYFPDQLSLGMARRAALARCLAVQPGLLLMDEPFASLDPGTADQLKSLIGGILDKRPEMAMICVTHDAGDAEDLANRLWYLDGQPARLIWDEEVSEAHRVRGRLAGLRAGARPA
ncbi:MAG: ATP-binding cassette domain-containing protein [Alteromonadaceae bacterium]|nr:ATP-binding cassette domain-containing protein [Alteromonadaceae bacterium]